MRGRTGRTTSILLLLLALSMLLALGMLASGCGGDDEESADTTEAVESETTEADGAATDTTAEDMAADESTADSDSGSGDPEFEVLDELPDDFPDIPLPDDTTLLEARSAEVPDGSGGTASAIAAAFESGTAPSDQYEHFKEALQDAGYELLMDTMTEEPVFLYMLSGSTDEATVLINGGDDPSEFESDFPGAENPFAIVAGPPGSF